MCATVSASHPQSTSTVVQEEIFGPVLVAYHFRTPKEAIALANNSRYGLASSVWTENLSLALEVALSIKAGTCWVNGHNMFDAAAGFGGYRESGFGRDGGKECLYEYSKPVCLVCRPFMSCVYVFVFLCIHLCLCYLLFGCHCSLTARRGCPVHALC